MVKLDAKVFGRIFLQRSTAFDLCTQILDQKYTVEKASSNVHNVKKHLACQHILLNYDHCEGKYIFETHLYT